MLDHDTLTIVQDTKAKISRETGSLVHKQPVSNNLTIANSREHALHLSDGSVFSLFVSSARITAHSSGAASISPIGEHSINIGIGSGTIEWNVDEPVASVFNSEVRLGQGPTLVDVVACVVLEPPALISHEFCVGSVTVETCIISGHVEHHLEVGVDRLELVCCLPNGLLGLEMGGLASALLHTDDGVVRSHELCLLLSEERLTGEINELSFVKGVPAVSPCFDFAHEKARGRCHDFA